MYLLHIIESNSPINSYLTSTSTLSARMSRMLSVLISISCLLISHNPNMTPTTLTTLEHFIPSHTSTLAKEDIQKSLLMLNGWLGLSIIDQQHRLPDSYVSLFILPQRQ